MTRLPSSVDVIVAGTGNAALCAALAALEGGASVLVAEKAPQGARGGNSRFALHYSFAYDGGIKDLTSLCPELGREVDAGRVAVGRYTRADLVDDVLRVSGPQTDRSLIEVLSERSLETMQWLTAHGVVWEINYPEAHDANGRLAWSNPALVLRPKGGGSTVLDALHRSIARFGDRVRIAYDSPLTGLRTDAEGRVRGAVISTDEGAQTVDSGSVILAAGGFEASPVLRARHLGPGWDRVKVRGTRHNTGDCLEQALAVGAQAAGSWSEAHATVVRAAAAASEVEPHAFPFAYPYGILINRRGERFVDEGQDVLHRTYGRLGRRVLEQPGAIAFELFDAQTRALRSRLADPGPYDQAAGAGSSVAEAAERCGGIDSVALARTVAAFNAAVDEAAPFDAARLDGRATRGLTIDKSNWALKLGEPPFELFAVAPAITFTYGGVRCDERARVFDASGTPIDGLFAAGEMAGTFYRDYPVGVAMTKGAVFGRLAGRTAAAVRTG